MGYVAVSFLPACICNIDQIRAENFIDKKIA
jgi:hypothetical protein